MATTAPERGRNLDLDAAIDETSRRFAAANPKSRAHYDQACLGLPGGNTPIAFAKDIRDEYAEAGRLLKRTKGKL